MVATPLGIVSQQDWPNPPRVTWYQSWTVSPTIPKAIFIWRDPLYTNPQTVTWYQSWIGLAPASVAASPLPPNQYDWPLPNRGSYYQVQTWIDSPTVKAVIPTNRIFRGPLYTNPRDYPYLTSLRSFFGAIPPAVLKTPFKQLDWPNPKDYQRLPYYAWTQSPRVPVVVIPFSQKDWPNPKDYPRLSDYTWVRTAPVPTITIIPFIFQAPYADIRGFEYPTALRQWIVVPFEPQLSQVKPFLQSDWPVPYPVQWYKDWYWTYNPNLVGQDRLPIRQQDWPNPYPVQWYREWIERLTPGAILAPFRQQDWPLPYPVQWYKSWEYQYIKELIGQDILPFIQEYWPLTPGQRLNDYGFVVFVPPPGVKLPFNQYTWPNPRDFQRLVDYFISQSPAVPPVVVVVSTDIHARPHLISMGRMGNIGGVS